MTLTRLLSPGIVGVATFLLSLPAGAADYPAPKEGDWVARDFTFHTGDVMAEVRLHYTTVGAPTGEPVLILHGTMGAGANVLNADFAGQLFGPGQPLDATSYYIILPDALGSGRSAKPSDGLRAKFPLYNYGDMVAAQHRLVTEGLGVRHLRLVIGNSMGGMHTWMWGAAYPGFMDALVPMASQPAEMSGRNWMTRRMLTEAIRRDPEWNGGDYTKQPTAFRSVNALFGLTTTGGTQGLYSQADTREEADRLVNRRLAALTTADANDFLYQWESSRDYNPAPGLDRTEAPLLAINSADDERNPPELGILERELTRVKNGTLYLIPASKDTRGHGTTGMAKFWKAHCWHCCKPRPGGLSGRGCGLGSRSPG